MIQNKESIIKDFKKILDDFQLKTGSNEITRDYYRKNSIYGKIFEKFFTFTELKKTYSINLPKIKINKKVLVISSILPNSEVNEQFVSAMELYCKENDAQLLLVPIRGVRSEFTFNKHVSDRYGKYFCTEAIFNSNLRLINTGITPNNKNPIKSIKELGHKNYSIIAASTKQCMEMIPSIHKYKTHLVYLTGTCSNIIYKNNITGHINNDNNKLGAIIVEIQDDKIFYIRNIEWINNYFVDLNKSYYSNKIKKINAEAIVAGDMHLSGDEDIKSLNLLKQEIKFLNCKKLFIHDFCSHNSINHHEKDNWISQVMSNKMFKNLEEEHKYTATIFNEWAKNIKHVHFYIVKSNHDCWLDKYLSSSNTWIKDPNNSLYCHKLCGYKLNNLYPFEHAIRKYLDKNILITFLDRQSIKICGIELSLHGDIGNNGGQASLKSLELSAGNCVIGHSHQPKIGFHGMQVGTNTKLDLGYNKGGSSWHNGNVSIYKDGHKQMLLGINYKICLKNI